MRRSSVELPMDAASRRDGSVRVIPQPLHISHGCSSHVRQVAAELSTESTAVNTMTLTILMRPPSDHLDGTSGDTP